MKDKLINLVRQAAEETNEALAKKIQVKGAETVLFVQGGMLDSLGLINLIVSLEGLIEQELGVTITLADERAISQKHSPFKTVGSLVDYMMVLLEEEKAVKG